MIRWACSGATTIPAARIAGKAKGGEIPASLAVRELSAGEAFLSVDRGEHAVRGFEDPVRLFEIRWHRWVADLAFIRCSGLGGCSERH